MIVLHKCLDLSPVSIRQIGYRKEIQKSLNFFTVANLPDTVDKSKFLHSHSLAIPLVLYRMLALFASLVK